MLACDIIAQPRSLSYALPVACEVGKAYDRALLHNGMSHRSAWLLHSIPFELHFLDLGYQYSTKLCCGCACCQVVVAHFLELFQFAG
jgi:hypothetical protein